MTLRDEILQNRMRKYIKKLQSKSESTRKQILVGSLIVSMFFVGVIWIGSFGQKFSSEKTVKVEEDIKPFSLFGKTISDTYNNITASVGNISLPNKQAEEKVETGNQINLIPVEYQS